MKYTSQNIQTNKQQSTCIDIRVCLQKQMKQYRQL